MITFLKHFLLLISEAKAFESLQHSLNMGSMYDNSPISLLFQYSFHLMPEVYFVVTDRGILSALSRL